MLHPEFSSILQIETDRLLLRTITKEDAPEILRLRSDDLVMRYIDKEQAVTIADAEAFINRITGSLNNNDGITWALCLKSKPGTLIGTIGYWRLIKDHYRAEIGYMLHPLHWNKGIMKEALHEVVKIGFTKLKLHSIEANINPDNTASAALLSSSGFVKEAYFKENFFFNGTFRDTVIYSRLQ